MLRAAPRAEGWPTAGSRHVGAAAGAGLAGLLGEQAEEEEPGVRMDVSVASGDVPYYFFLGGQLKWKLVCFGSTRSFHV